MTHLDLYFTGSREYAWHVQTVWLHWKWSMTKQSLLSQHWKVAARVSDLSAVVSDIVWHLTAGHTLHTHCTGPGGGTDHRWRSSTSVARAQARRLVTAKLTLWNSRQLIRLCYLTHFTTKTRFIKYRVSSNYKIGPLWQVWSSLRSMKMRSEKFWVWILHKFVYGRVWLLVVGWWMGCAAIIVLLQLPGNGAMWAAACTRHSRDGNHHPQS